MAADYLKLQNPYAKANNEGDKEPSERETNFVNILEECSVIGRSRMEKYGDPLESMPVAVGILKNAFGLNLTIEQICYVLVALKFSRQCKQFSEDNILDSINYLAIALNSRREKYVE